MLISNSFLGRKKTMAMTSALTALSLILFTTQGDPNYQLVAACCASLSQNITYAVFYAYNAEVYPTHVRGFFNLIVGTANGLADSIGKGFAVAAPFFAG
jgi:MFS family permease